MALYGRTVSPGAMVRLPDMFVPFLFELRKRKVKVGLQEATALARALSAGLHDSSLDGFYHVARALCVHTETHLDALAQASLASLRGSGGTALELDHERA